jgi:amidohydrolase
MTNAKSNSERKADLAAIVEAHKPDLHEFEEIYKDIHSHPELGTHESRTSEIASKHLKDLGFNVTDKIGGYGVIGNFTNGPGLILMLRADMDALPISENTRLPYASKVLFKDSNGIEKPVMHACGHDMHVTALMATASLLVKAKEKWSGTLTCIFQPNEENGAGAMAMVKDGLYNHAPKPDIVLAQHVDHRRNGNIAIRSGPCESAADSFLVTLFGKGGHGSKPESCIDPIVMGCHTIVRLQAIVSRLVAPQDEVVLTCGSFHGGDAHNIIPDFVEFKINVRTYNDKVRTKVLKAIKDIIHAECSAVGAPREPVIERTHEYPLTSNDPKLAEELRALFIDHFGESHVEEMEKLAGSEDFPNLALPHNAPYVIWFWGATAVERYDEAIKDGTLDQLPQIHSSEFAPSIRPTLETGVRALSLAALNYLT